MKKKLEKMNFANMQKLSRKEMKVVMAGSGASFCACESYVCARSGLHQWCGYDACCSNTGSGGSW